MRFRRVLLVMLGVLGVAVTLGTVVIILLVTVDLRPLIERYGSRALDRRLTIATLRIGWGNPLSIGLEGLRLANADWGSDPEMIRIASLSADLDLRALLAGVLRFERLHVYKPSVLLERKADGTPNWHFAGQRRSASSGFALIPKNRMQFPTLLDLALQGGAFTYHTPDVTLHLDADALAIRAGGDDQPVTLTLKGSYNGNPLALNAKTASFRRLRDAAVPFDTAFSITGTGLKIDFAGTMMEPLDVEGARGKLDIDAQQLGDLMKILGLQVAAAVPVRLVGTFTHQGDDWQLAAMTGTLMQNDVTGLLALKEAGRAKPDAVRLDLDFARLDLTSLLGAGRADSKARHDDIALQLEPDPAATVAARIHAKQVAYGSLTAADLALDGQLMPGQLSLEKLSFGLFGGQVDIVGSARNAAVGSRINASSALSGIEIDQIAQWAGAGAGQIAGSLDGRAALDMTGRTLTEALRDSQGQAVLAMAQGRVARALVEKLSADLRIVFRQGEGWVPLTCLLGVVDLRAGVATISPLRLVTPEAKLVGAGQINLMTQRVDLTIKAKGDSVFALGVPLRIAGDLSKPRVQPALGSSSRLDALSTGAIPPLAPDIQALVARNPCQV